MILINNSLTMITNFAFDDTEDLMNFLYYHSLIGTWEVLFARLIALDITTITKNGVEQTVVTDGMTMNLATQKKNVQGKTVYLTLNDIKILINNFFNNNIDMQVNVELKLKYPYIQKHVMDINDYYDSFILNCYSNPANKIHYAAVSFIENTSDLPAEPITNWAIYIKSLYNDYQNSKQ